MGILNVLVMQPSKMLPPLCVGRWIHHFS